MPFVAEENKNWELWDYILGNEYIKSELYDGIYHNGAYGLSIATSRYYYLQELERMNNGLKISCRDPDTNFWTKWVPFPGLLSQHGYNNSGITAAVDVHRNVLTNEIVIESDYKTYEENYDASKIIGAILEHKGFIPHYYYSGNKSIHIHVFLDWNVLDAVFWDDFNNCAREMSTLIEMDIGRFKTRFIEWLRKKMISCWDIKAREFDPDLIKATHLIRAELSKNKRGFKTFLGYTHKDLSFVPYICNEKNRIYPRLAEVRLSQPYCIKELIEEFNLDLENKSKIKKIQKKNWSLAKWIKPSENKLRECVKSILSDDFVKVNDGLSRGMFILTNELRRVFGDEVARTMINDWNNRMGGKIKQSEIDYRFKLKNYTLTCERIHNFLKEVGMDIGEKCKHKV